MTEDQKNMIRENQETRKQQRSEFRNNATEEQQQQMQQNRDNTGSETGKHMKGR